MWRQNIGNEETYFVICEKSQRLFFDVHLAIVVILRAVWNKKEQS